MLIETFMFSEPKQIKNTALGDNKKILVYLDCCPIAGKCDIAESFSLQQVGKDIC